MDNNGAIWVKNGSDKRKVVAKEELLINDTERELFIAIIKRPNLD